MSVQKISARAGKEENSPSVEVEYDFGDNMAEAAEKFGDDVVYTRFKAAATIDIQAIIRRHLTATDKDGKPVPKTSEQIQEIVKAWVPGVSQRVRKTDKQKAAELLGKLDPAALAELLASLQTASTPSESVAA